MINVGEELAVQSWCFRGFEDNAEAIEKIKACGISKVELSSAHVDFADEGSFDEVIALYAAGGVDIVAIGAVRFGGDESAERKYFEFVRKAGADYLTVDFAVDSVPESYRIAEKLAAEYDVRLGIHNHGGRHWLGSCQMLAHVLANTSERIGLCLDTAWAMDSREDPIAMAERFADRLYGLHIKDFVFDRARNPEDVVVGTGNLSLPKLHETLEKIDFSGRVILEYEGDVKDPVPAVSECVKAIREQMAG